MGFSHRYLCNFSQSPYIFIGCSYNFHVKKGHIQFILNIDIIFWVRKVRIWSSIEKSSKKRRIRELKEREIDLSLTTTTTKVR